MVTRGGSRGAGLFLTISLMGRIGRNGCSEVWGLGALALMIVDFGLVIGEGGGASERWSFIHQS
jgi:hypothetical protein